MAVKLGVDTLVRLAAERGIRIEYRPYSRTLMRPMVDPHGTPVIRVTNILRDAPAPVATAVLDYYCGPGGTERLKSLIVDYVRGRSPGRDPRFTSGPKPPLTIMDAPANQQSVFRGRGPSVGPAPAVRPTAPVPEPLTPIVPGRHRTATPDQLEEAEILSVLRTDASPSGRSQDLTGRPVTAEANQEIRLELTITPKRKRK